MRFNAVIWCSLFIIFCNLNMTCRGVDFLVVILLRIIWASWLYSLMSIINFRKILAIFTSIIYSLLCLPSPSGIPTMCMLHLLWFSHSSCMFCSMFIIVFLFQFHLRSSFWPIFKITDSFFCLVQSTDELIKCTHFCPSVTDF